MNDTAKIDALERRLTKLAEIVTALQKQNRQLTEAVALIAKRLPRGEAPTPDERDAS